MAFSLANGISIPSSYSAHMAPLSSSKLYNEVRAGKDEKASETPYVVMFQAVNILSGQGDDDGGRCRPQIQECWEFEHPRRDVVLDERGTSTRFCNWSMVTRPWADSFYVSFLFRVTSDQQPQCSFSQVNLSYPSCRGVTRACWLLRGCIVWRDRAQHSPPPEGSNF